MVASARASTARNLRTVDAISDSAAAKRTSAERIFGRLTVGLGANGTAATMLAAVKPASKYERAVRYTIILRREWNIRQVGARRRCQPRAISCCIRGSSSDYERLSLPTTTHVLGCKLTADSVGTIPIPRSVKRRGCGCHDQEWQSARPEALPAVAGRPRVNLSAATPRRRPKPDRDPVCRKPQEGAGVASSVGPRSV